MAQKFKGFGKLLNEQRSEKVRQETLEKFGRNLRQGPLGEAFPDVVMTSNSEVKMSKVLKLFVAPYMNQARTRNRREKLFGLAIFAWNLALMPEDERQPMINQFITRDLKISDPSIQKDTGGLIQELLARRLECFAGNQHYILSYELNNRGNQYQIAVASTIMDQPAAK